MKKHITKRCSYVRLILLEQILAQWWRPVASVEALDLLYQVMHAVAYRRIAMAIGMAGKAGVFFIVIVLYVTLAAAGAIHSGYLPNGGFQWLLPKP
jgi:hypothetical protein